jgi:hypothetical protein
MVRGYATAKAVKRRVTRSFGLKSDASCLLSDNAPIPSATPPSHTAGLHYRWEAAGLITLVRVGGKTLITDDEIDRILSGQVPRRPRLILGSSERTGPLATFLAVSPEAAGRLALCTKPRLN